MLYIADSIKERNILPDGLKVNESNSSSFVTVQNRLILPESKIILPESFSDQEKQFLSHMNNEKRLIL